VEAQALNQIPVFEAAVTFARTEGIISAPETSHAIASVIDEAIKAREEGKAKVILFNWSGHGLMDLLGYDAYMSGKLVNYPLPEDDLKRSLKSIESLPKAPLRKTGRW
jgi:tryptophan synthase beta chain